MKKIAFYALILICVLGCSSNKVESLSKKLDKNANRFLIDNSSDTLIVGSEGTMLFIAKNSFVNSSGSIVQDSISIELKELYKIEDIIAQNISMEAGDRILETGGMINLKAYSAGSELSLANAKEVVVHFPKNGNTKEMNLFYGEKDTNQVIKWEIEEASTYRLLENIHPWFTKYEGLDDENLTLDNNEPWWIVLPRLFNLTEEEKTLLLNKTVDLNYKVDRNGNLIFENTTGSKISRNLRIRLEGVAKNFPKCKPYTVNGKPIDMPGFFKVYARVIEPKHVNRMDYLEAIERKIGNGSSRSLDIAELQYYIFDSKKLGWMNCDRFINATKEKVNFTVRVPKSNNVFAKIVFSNYKTVMTGDEGNNKFVFNNLPLGEPLKIIVLDQQNGSPLLKIVDTIVQREPIRVDGLQEYTLTDLKVKLKELN